MPAGTYPFVWASSGLAMGILLGEADELSCVIGLLFLVGAASYAWWGVKWGRLVWSLPLFALIGAVRTQGEKYLPPPSLHQFQGHIVTLSGYLTEEPLPGRKTYRLIVRIDSIYAFLYRSTFAVAGRCLVYVRDSTVRFLPIGSRIRVTLRLDTLRYGKAYWAQQGIRLGGFTERVERGPIELTYVWGHLMRWRQAIVQAMLENAPKEDASLAVIQALLLGYKRGVDPETRQAFQLSGTAHILAVSGMHVGLVLTLWLFLLRRFPPLWSHHPVSQVALLFWIVFYGLLTGASPSAMRAVIMSSVALIARMLYKPYFALNALGFAAFLQLSFSPTLLYDVGFQLSYAAVGGILAFYTGVLKLLRYTPKDSSILKYLKELIAISVAAQAGTFLLGWAYFGRLPLYFLVANLLAVPVATGLTFVGMFWLFCLPIPVLAKLVAWGPHLLAKLLIAIVYFLSQLPGASVELPRFPPGMAALLSLLLLIGGGVLVERYLRKGETPWVV